MAGRTPRPHRAHSRYLCNLRDWVHSQSYAAGLPAVCHKWSSALPPQAYATTRNSPRLGAPPGLRWQRERLQCQRHLASVYTICPAGLAPWLMLVSSQNKEKTFVMVYRQPKWAYCAIFAVQEGVIRRRKEGEIERERERAKSETTKPSCYAFGPVRLLSRVSLIALALLFATLVRAQVLLLLPSPCLFVGRVCSVIV